MRLLVLAAAFTLTALAQAPRFPTPPPADGPKQPVSGRVVNAETGQPVRGAQLTLIQGREELESAYSDAEGRFRMDEAPVGEWSATAVKSGYARLMEQLVVPAAQPLSGVELRMHRHAVITGRVVDHLRRPVVGAKVIALAPRFEEGESLLRPASSGPTGRQTDDRGEYRIWGLSPGPHVVAVYPASEPSAAGVVRFSSSGAFYPNAPSVAEAERVRVEWGQVREGVDLRLGPPAETRTILQAVLPGGREGPCETCSVQLMLDDPEALVQIGGAQLGAGNTVVIEGLLAGRYAASLRGFERSTSSMWHGLAPFEVTTGAADPVAAPLWGEVPLKGRVVLEDRPEEQRAGPFRFGLRAMPPARSRSLGRITRGMFANLEIEGTEAEFEMSCFPGDIELQLLGGDSYIAGISLNGKPLESAKLTVPPEGFPDGLVIRVRFDAGTLEGTIDPKPTPGAAGLAGPGYAAFARPAEPDRSFTRGRYVRVMPDGTIRQRLPPGSYELVAFPSGPSGAVMSDPLWEASMRKLTRRVEIKAGETAQVTLPVATEP